MKINTELLRATLVHIDRHRDDWRQASWRHCFAAHAAIIDGGRWAIPDPGHDLSWLLKPVRHDRRHDVAVYGPADGWDGKPLRAVHVRTRATRLLGLEPEQASHLFWAANDLPRLHLIVSELCEVAA
ncbi:hypothetical protein ACGF0J_21675 [Nonomuraea sp. NPDC047897]|uniref:hypothetical protein n=1 Tax=Nonomuraea sp. NPDC047897 TaxID=3364346 RepID=UPI0037149BF4